MSAGRRGEPAPGGGHGPGGAPEEGGDAGAGAGDDGAVDRADYDPTYDPGAPVVCEVCGGEMSYTAACKLKCRRCGYMRDCSDP